MAKKKRKRLEKKKSIIDKIKKYKLHLLVIAIILVFGAISYAQEENIISAMKDLCINARAILATGAMILVILAAAVYAIGQIVGAETRARASVWATAMITGAVIGIIIYLIVPNVVSFLMTGKAISATATGGDPCNFAFGGAADSGGSSGGTGSSSYAVVPTGGGGPSTPPPGGLPWKKIP